MKKYEHSRQTIFYLLNNVYIAGYEHKVPSYYNKKYQYDKHYRFIHFNAGWCDIKIENNGTSSKNDLDQSTVDLLTCNIFQQSCGIIPDAQRTRKKKKIEK